MDDVISVLLYIALAWMMYKASKYAFYSRYKIRRNLAWTVMLVIPSTVAALRENTGTDSLMYRMLYENPNSVHRYQELEAGYVILVKILNRIHVSYRVLFFVMMFFTVLFVMLLLENEKEYINVQVASFIFMMSLFLSGFNTMRQGLAMAMLLYAMSVCMDGKTWRSIAVILGAALFHGSALVGLAIILGKIIFEGKYWKECLAGGCLVLIYLITHRELLSRLVYMLTRSTYYASYVSRNSASESSMLIYAIKISFVVILGFLYRGFYIDEAKRMKVYYAMLVCGYIFSALNIITMTYVGRVGEYFSYLYIVLMGFCADHNLPFFGRTVRKRDISILIMAYFLLVFLHQNVYRGYHDLIPYQGWFWMK